MECPKCGSEIGRSHQCGCGWKTKTAREVARQIANPLGYTQCDWEADGMRCQYPGTISPSTNGPNYCRLHFGCDDPVFGATVAEASRDYVHRSSRETTKRDIERLNAEARAWCAENGFARADGESREEWVKRLLAYRRDKVMRVARKAA